jgi:hypothetical protein
MVHPYLPRRALQQYQEHDRGKVIWEIWAWQTKQGVCHTVALPFTLKSILWQKKNYENSDISLDAKIQS